MKKIFQTGVLLIAVMLVTVPMNAIAQEQPATCTTCTGTTKEELPGESDIYQGGNNVLDLDIGETASTLWQYRYDGVNWGESCWREEYSLWYNSEIHESSGFQILDLYGPTYNDADKHARLQTGNLYIDRDIYIPTGNNRFFQISYVITNQGTYTYTDVRFFQQVDYDVPTTYPYPGGDEFTDDIGWYDSATDFVWIKDPDYFQNGFTGSRPSDDYGMWWYDWELYTDDHDGDLNSVDYYDQTVYCPYWYECGDPAVGLQYNVGTLEPEESWDITMTFWFGLPITVTANAGSDQTVNEGDTVTFDGSGSHTTGPNVITEYAWDFDGDFDYDDGSVVSPSYIFGDNGLYQVWLRVTDDYGQQAFDSMSVTVNNVAPTADFDNTGPTDEGSAVTVSFTNQYDPAGIYDSFTYSFDWENDGIYNIVDQVEASAGHMWCDNGVYTVKGQIEDDDGGYTEYTTDIQVYNVPPEITDLTVSPSLVAIGETVTLEATFMDPGCDDHTADIDWDNDGIIDETIYPITSSISLPHSYADTGVYTVTLTVTDDDGGSDTMDFRYILVYDPSAGFVTGGGWINSPDGAYTPDPTLTGKAHFGFVSKYKKGQQNPAGNTEFQFQVADLNFHSTEYDWLVINHHKAMYKGTGTINNAGNYGFMLIVIDEKLTPSTDVDLFRIKIWDKDNSDAIVYDNQLGNPDDADPTTEIAGGQIVIHKG